MKKILFFLLTIVLACTPSAKEDEAVHGLDPANMDLTANPKTDFYQFANGTWLEETKIPEDEGSWGGFGALAKQTNQEMLDILEGAIKSGVYVEGTDQKKAADFFSTGMDSLLAEKAGVAPVEELFTKIDNVSDQASLQEVMAELHVYGISPFYNISVFADLMDSDMNAFYVVAGGLGLPNKDYYTKQDEKSVELREKYVAHIARMMAIANESKEVDQYTEMADRIMAIEYQLADASLTPIEQRDFSRLYNPMTKSELAEMVPIIDWDSYFENIYVEGVDSMIVFEPRFMKEVDVVLNETSIDDIKDYMKWHVINAAAGYLNHETVQANFDFFSKELSGVTEMRPRWRRVLANTNGVMGEALGQLYVDKAFPPEAKAAAEEMVNNILAAMKNRIEELEWMSDETKEQALKKLGAMKVKIGYPDEWKDYSNLIVESSGETYSYYGNILHANKYQHMDAVDKIGKPVDKTEWALSPQTVNAGYSPLSNEIIFPAAILQPPFYDYKADPAVNYGGIGAVIGHEISHGFDDQGSRFDADGNMVNWWTERDKEEFKSRSQVLVDQFNQYEVLDSVYVQGELTLGENIGDIAGLNIAYDGMKIYFEKNDKPGPIDGYTQEQRFFLSWATIWRTKSRDEYLRNQVLIDPHSPGMIRAVGPLTNLPTFYAAFDIEPGDPMWRPDSSRVKIW